MMAMPLDSERLNAWHEGRLVGELWRDEQDRIGFAYHPEWLEDGFRIGHVLPLQSDPFAPESSGAHAWFANLLPEGAARERIVRKLGIADDDFALLREIGGDCAGALSLQPIHQSVDLHGGADLLDDQTFARMLKQRGQEFLPQTSGSQAWVPRLSLAGAQAKCPILLQDDGYFLPRGQTASSHILKFELPQWRHVPVFELFLNRIAEGIGLPVPETRMETHHGHRYLIIERFDREFKAGNWHRLHQEDFCQIAGLRATRKYQAEGGPGIAACAPWIRALSEQPAEDLLNLLRWQAFNWLAGNSDGHAKNLAMVQVQMDTHRWRLAPFYDLVCTRAWPNLDRRLAMDIGGESDPGKIRFEHWERLAREMAMRPRFVFQEIERLAEAIETILPDTRANLEAEHGPLPMLQQPEKIIRTQLRIARKMVG